MEKVSFKFTSGRLCLDFVNTVRHRLTNHPHELLGSYADLVAWGRQAGVLAGQEGQALLREAKHRPPDAQAALRRAVAIREALYRIFTAVAAKRPPASEDMTALNAVLGEALAAARVVVKGHSFAWGWAAGGDGLNHPLWPVARSAAEVLTSDEAAAVRKCAAADCAWVFMDQSRNGSRRWCDMKVCGNRAKARRHYARQQAGR